MLSDTCTQPIDSTAHRQTCSVMGARYIAGQRECYKEIPQSMLFVEAGVGRPSRWALIRLVRPLKFPKGSKYPLHTSAHLCSTMRMPRVTVILTDEEYTQVKREAGLIPLSAWFRSKTIGAGEDKAVRRDEPVHLARGRSVAADLPSESSEAFTSGACPHHKRKGELCYKCDTKWGNPVICRQGE
jgi:hypothetical protein